MESKRSTSVARDEMQMVGYDAMTEMIELACVLERGEHINGWELIDLWHALTERQLDERRPLKAARVVFSDQWAAASEKRVLLDIGAHVFYTDDDARFAPSRCCVCVHRRSGRGLWRQQVVRETRKLAKCGVGAAPQALG